MCWAGKLAAAAFRKCSIPYSFKLLYKWTTQAKFIHAVHRNANGDSMAGLRSSLRVCPNIFQMETSISACLGLGWKAHSTARYQHVKHSLTSLHAGPTQRNHCEDLNWIPNKALVSGPLWGALLRAAGWRQNEPRNQVTNSCVASLGLPLWVRMAARFQVPRLYSMVGPL